MLVVLVQGLGLNFGGVGVVRIGIGSGLVGDSFVGWKVLDGSLGPPEGLGCWIAHFFSYYAIEGYGSLGVAVVLRFLTESIAHLC